MPFVLVATWLAAFVAAVVVVVAFVVFGRWLYPLGISRPELLGKHLLGRWVKRIRRKPGRLHAASGQLGAKSQWLRSLKKEGDAVIVVVRHWVASKIRSEYNLCCIRRYTTLSVSIAEHLIAETSENSAPTNFGEIVKAEVQLRRIHLLRTSVKKARRGRAGV